MFGKSSPEKILKDVEIYLSDINVPNYAAVQALKKGIKAFPDNNELKSKLKEIEVNTDIGISQSSPKLLYGILVIVIGVMGLGLLTIYLSNTEHTLSLLLGASFLLCAFVIFNQYRKEK